MLNRRQWVCRHGCSGSYLRDVCLAVLPRWAVERLAPGASRARLRGHGACQAPLAGPVSDQPALAVVQHPVLVLCALDCNCTMQSRVRAACAAFATCAAPTAGSTPTTTYACLPFARKATAGVYVSLAIAMLDAPWRAHSRRVAQQVACLIPVGNDGAPVWQRRCRPPATTLPSCRCSCYPAGRCCNGVDTVGASSCIPSAASHGAAGQPQRRGRRARRSGARLLRCVSPTFAHHDMNPPTRLAFTLPDGAYIADRRRAHCGVQRGLDPGPIWRAAGWRWKPLL
jgi:hypothetical protein